MRIIKYFLKSKLMKYRHIVFDIDGTMLDSAYADLIALQKVIWEFQNKKHEISDLYFALGIPSEVVLKRLGIKEVAMASKLWDSYTKELSYTMKLFDGIKELLIELSGKGAKLGIITSKSRNEYFSDFSPFELDSYFDTVITVEDSILPKPSAAPMLSYLTKTGASPQEIIYIGDTLYDWECAKNAGVDFGLAMWGNPHVEQIDVIYSFKTPEEILSSLISDNPIWEKQRNRK